MTPKPLRFYLYQDIAGVPTYYVVDGTGNVVTTINKDIAEVEYSPEQWKELEDGYTRSMSMHGIMTRLTNEYTFFGDGAKILNWHVFTKGYDAALKLLVEELQQDSSGFYYTEFANSDIDFGEPQIDHTGTEITLTEKGLGQDLMQNLNTPFNITIDGGDQVYFAGTKVKGKYGYRYSGIRSQSIIDNVVGPGLGDGEYFNLLLVATTTEGFKPVVVQKNQEIFRMGLDSSPVFYGDEAYSKYALMNADNDNIDVLFTHPACIIRWKYEDLGIGSTPISAQFSYYLIIAAENEPFARSAIHVGSVVSAASGVYQYESVGAYTGSFTLAPGERVYICGVITQTTTVSGAFFTNMEDPEIVNPVFETTSLTKPTFVNGLSQRLMWEKTMVALADGKYGSTPADSPILSDPTLVLNDNSPYYTYYTTALHLRGQGAAQFKIQPGELIKDLQSRYPGAVIMKSNLASFDHISKAYDDSVTIADIGVLSDWKITPLNMMGTTLVFGNDFNTTDLLNGADDYNTKSTFVTSARFEQDKEMDFTSKYITSVKSIEKERVEEYGKDTTTSTISDKVFVFSAYPYAGPGGMFLNYPAQTGGVVTGVFFPDWAYNVDLSPRRNALRLSPLINSYTYPSTTPIKFRRSERNSALISNFATTGSVAENSDIVPDSNAVFLPFILKGKSVKPLNLNQMMKDNPYGAVAGTLQKADGTIVPFRAYIKEVKVRPVAKNEFQWDLLLAPSTDILKII